MRLKSPEAAGSRRLKQRDLAKLLGVTEGRVSQLKSSGELTDFTELGAQQFLRARQQRETERRAFKERQDAARKQEHEEMLEELRRLNRNVELVLGVVGVGAIASAVNGRGQTG